MLRNGISTVLSFPNFAFYDGAYPAFIGQKALPAIHWIWVFRSGDGETDRFIYRNETPWFRGSS